MYDSDEMEKNYKTEIQYTAFQITRKNLKPDTINCGQYK